MKGIEFLISLKEKMAKPLENINKKLEKTKGLAAKLKNFVISPRVNTEGIDRMSNSLSGLKSLATKLVAGAALIAFTHNVTDALAQTEKFEVVLTKTLGNKAIASSSLEYLSQFADKTNFTTEELTDNYIKLANRGLRPTEKAFTAIGDVANVLGKDFSQVNEAILDISNSERWKELGIKSEVAGDKVKLTFRGITQTVDGTEKGVLDAVTAFGQMNGVLGVTEEISQTTGGKLSTLEDSISRLYKSIGEGLKPQIHAIIDALAEFVQFGGLLLQKAKALKGAFLGIKEALQPLIDSFYDAAESLGLVGTSAVIAESIINKIAVAIEFLKPMIAVVAELGAEIMRVITNIINMVMNVTWINKTIGGLVEGFKTAFITIAKIAKNVLGGIGDLVVGILSGDLGMIGSGFKKLGGAIVETLGAPVKVLMGAGKGVAEGFMQNKPDLFKNKQEEEKKKVGLATDGESQFDPTNKDKTKAKKNKAEARVNAVTGEARNQRNITINIGTLKGAEKIEVTASTIGDFMNQSKFEKMLTEALLRSVRNAETSF